LNIIQTKSLSDLTDEQVDELRALPGLVATTITSGIVQPEYAQALSDLRSVNDRAGFWAIEYRPFYALFVAIGRDAICAHALKHDYKWILMVDADAAPFPEESLLHMLRLGFIDIPWTDVISAYCQQKGSPFCPTIDTGTGTWERHFPGSGVLEVIRTGGHFLFIKQSALRRFGPPWFQPRTAPDAAETMADFDNLCRRNFDGHNPFSATPDYRRLEEEVVEGERRRVSGEGEANVVGEDSGFCDGLTAAGGRIAVDTSIVVGHIDKKIILPKDFKDAIEELERKKRLTVGVEE